jgi:hypothetical protein
MLQSKWPPIIGFLKSKFPALGYGQITLVAELSIEVSIGKMNIQQLHSWTIFEFSFGNPLLYANGHLSVKRRKVTQLGTLPFRLLDYLI